MFNKHDLTRDECMLTGAFRNQGYDWWWHSFTARHAESGAEKPFFIEYFLCNPALGGEKPIFGQLPENKEQGKRPSYLMVKAGCWGTDHCQLHRFFGWKDVAVYGQAPYRISADDCLASERELRGSIAISKEEALAHPEYMCDAGALKWDLKIDKQVAFNVGYGASRFLRAIKAFEMYWHAEGMKSLYSGEIIFNGERYIVTPESSFGYADKNWGIGFTSPWVWLASCNLKSNLTGKTLSNSVFDIGGGRPRIYSLALNRKLLGAFFYEGKAYEYNFSKFWTAPKTEFEGTETETEIRWHVRLENRNSVMIIDLSCEKAHMLLMNYEAPDGSKRHNRLWNGGDGQGRIQLFEKTAKGLALIDDMRVANVGCEYGEYDKAD